MPHPHPFGAIPRTSVVPPVLVRLHSIPALSPCNICVQLRLQKRNHGLLTISVLISSYQETVALHPYLCRQNITLLSYQGYLQLTSRNGFFYSSRTHCLLGQFFRYKPNENGHSHYFPLCLSFSLLALCSCRECTIWDASFPPYGFSATNCSARAIPVISGNSAVIHRNTGVNIQEVI